MEGVSRCAPSSRPRRSSTQRHRGQDACLRAHTHRQAGSTLQCVESLHSLRACIWTMNCSVGTPLVWSPAFRRSGPVKAGTSNGRFMESPLSFFRMQWDHELPGGCSTGVLACEFSGRPARCSCWRRDAAATRSRDGCATRFMESPHSFLRMPWDHEPFCTPGQGTRPTCCRPGALSGRFLEKYCNFWPAKSVKNLAWGELWSLELGV